MIPYGRQSISDADVEVVVETLRSAFLTQGPAVPAFEKAVAGHVGADYGVAVNSATSALHVACLALGLGPGDVLWTSPVSFVASSNCALYCGAEVDFVDIDPRTANMSVDALRSKLEHARKVGKLPKIVVPVHLTGLSCDMAAIAALSNEYGFRVIEDASHAIGGRYRDRFVGSCQYSDIAVFSFHPVKIVTTAEGGMGVTNSPELARRMALFRSHGVTRDKDLMSHSDGPWYYQQIELGFNYRMTDLQAALGRSQMSRLDELVARRNGLADRYDSELSGLPVTLPVRLPDTLSAFHLYVVRLTDEAPRGHLEVFERLRADGIGVNLHYIPIHLQPYYARLGFRAGQFPVAEDYYSRAISIPMFPDLTEAEQDQVVGALRSALS